MKNFQKKYLIGDARLDVYVSNSDLYINIDVYENANSESYNPYRFDMLSFLTGRANVNRICSQNGFAEKDISAIIKKYAVWYVKANFDHYSEN